MGRITENQIYPPRCNLWTTLVSIDIHMYSHYFGRVTTQNKMVLRLWETARLYPKAVMNIAVNKCWHFRHWVKYVLYKSLVAITNHCHHFYREYFSYCYTWIQWTFHTRLYNVMKNKVLIQKIRWDVTFLMLSFNRSWQKTELYISRQIFNFPGLTREDNVIWLLLAV